MSLAFTWPWVSGFREEKCPVARFDNLNTAIMKPSLEEANKLDNRMTNSEHEQQR
jgi:hypothetical protein